MLFHIIKFCMQLNKICIVDLSNHKYKFNSCKNRIHLNKFDFHLCKIEVTLQKLDFENIILIFTFLNSICIKLNFSIVKQILSNVILNFTFVKIILIFVKFNFSLVKFNFISVKLNFILVKQTCKRYSYLVISQNTTENCSMILYKLN